MARCPRCAHEFFSRIELPVEPLFTLNVAAELVPFSSPQALSRYLRRHKKHWQKFYGPIAFRVTRFLTADQVRELRAERIREGFRNPRRDGRRRQGARQAS